MNSIMVEVAYAQPNRQTLLQLKVPAEYTVAQAIEVSGILKQHPEISLSTQTVGIWSKPCDLGTKLKQHDRIEIYRPIQADPKKARISRVNKS